MVRPKGQSTIKNRIVKSMKEMGTYSKHYDDIIEIYSGLLYDYQNAREEFLANGSQFTEEHETGRGTIVERKTPLVQSMENLRKDIVTYSDRLGLNPKAVGIEPPKPKDAGGLEGMIANLL
ncbi:TPA: P27 family phage terminase small subunit [Streptococcus pneumoniae]|nr:P27 family phage terminase small subunit [Streptococcus pneumoniae]